MFKKRENVADIEEGNLLSPKFDNDGLIPVVTTCVNTLSMLNMIIRVAMIVHVVIMMTVVIATPPCEINLELLTVRYRSCF